MQEICEAWQDWGAKYAIRFRADSGQGRDIAELLMANRWGCSR
jgi:hypothetical protein